MTTASVALHESASSAPAPGDPSDFLFGTQTGPFAAIPEKLAQKVLARAKLVRGEAGEKLVEQFHQAGDFFFLLDGQVEFHIALESASELLLVGTSEKPWTPVGWSSFRAPKRYATSVTCTRQSRLLRFEVKELHALFAEEPDAAYQFFRIVNAASEGLLVEAREKLINQLRPGTSIPHWGSAFDRARAITRRLRPRQRRVSIAPTTTDPTQVSPIPFQEGMVTNAAPELSDLFRSTRFFEQFPEGFLDALAANAEVHYFCRGEVLAQQGEESSALLILADGKVRLEYASASMRTAVLRLISAPGSVLSPSNASGRACHDVTVRATRDGSMVKVPSEVLSALANADASWGALLSQRVLASTSRELRATRVHLVSETFDRELLAVESLLEQVRTELPVSSPLHKLPHLLQSAVTMPDALAIVNAERESKDQLSSHTASVLHELLGPMRRENRFFAGLSAAYQETVDASTEESPATLRRKCAANFIRVFSEIPSEVRGLENLPARPGHIFIFNHLKNHEYNTLPNGFQLTLDSHFISSMILQKKYGDPGLRVVRESRANEYGHQSYYGRLGHISVYTPESDNPTEGRDERFQHFIETASNELSRGQNLVLAPEGTSHATESSPGRFKAGAFRLAGSVSPEPLIVPIAMAHFDRRLAHTKLAAVIHRPFRISDHVSDVNDPKELRNFLDEYQRRFSQWVREAAQLARHE